MLRHGGGKHGNEHFTLLKVKLSGEEENRMSSP